MADGDTQNLTFEAEERRRTCLSAASTFVLHNLLLPWEAVDYAKYLEDYLATGKVPLEPKPKAKRTLH